MSGKHTLIPKIARVDTLLHSAQAGSQIRLSTVIMLKSTFVPIDLASCEVVGWSSFHTISGGTSLTTEPTLKDSDDYLII